MKALIHFSHKGAKVLRETGELVQVLMTHYLTDEYRLPQPEVEPEADV